MEFQCYCGTRREAEISDQYKCRTRDGLYMHVHANGGMFSGKVVKSHWNVVA